MKKIFVLFFVNIVNILFFTVHIFAQTNLSIFDKEEIVLKLEILARSINIGDSTTISYLISPDNQILRFDIQEKIKKGITYQLYYEPFDRHAEIISSDKVKIQAKFSAIGDGWEINGFSTYFVFEKKNNQWVITDTDFHKKLEPDYALSVFKNIFIIVFIIIFILFFSMFLFWFWMFIDCIKREFDDKTLWIIILLFFNFMGAILYYFLIKRKKVVREIPECKL